MTKTHGTPFALLALIPVLAACGAEPPPAPAGGEGGLEVAAISDVILERLALQPGERVLLVAAPGRFDPLVPLLREGVEEAGGVDLGAWSVTGDVPESWATAFTDSIAPADEGSLVPLLRSVDAGLMLPGAGSQHPVYAGLQEVLREGLGRTVHFHWAGAYGLDNFEFPVDAREDSVYQRALMDTDHRALGRAQADFEEAMRDATVRVTDPRGTDLSFRIGDRPVNRQDGDASAARAARGEILIDREIELPAGAVRVAPLEETVNGRIAFPPTVWIGPGGEPTNVEGLVLTFEDGRVVDATAGSGLEAAVGQMDAAGPAGRAFRELVLGFNPLLAIPEEDPWIPYYGYGAGVVRLSLGDNSELGGNVGGGYVRWNFFTDATVTVGDETWVEGGRLVR